MTPDLLGHLEALGRALSVAPPSDLPELLGELERLRAAAWMRASSPLTSLPHGGHRDANLSAPEAAGRLGVSVAWLYKNARKLPFAVRIGRRLLFSAHGLERWNRQRQGR